MEKIIIALDGRSFYSDIESGTIYILSSELNRCDPHKNINIHMGANEKMEIEKASPFWGMPPEADKLKYRCKECQFFRCAKTSLRERAIETKKIILASLAEAQKSYRFLPHEF